MATKIIVRPSAPLYVDCETCKGEGVDKVGNECKTCDGTGMILKKQEEKFKFKKTKL
jgi:DnaJ-class molecular chaperone